MQPQIKCQHSTDGCISGDEAVQPMQVLKTKPLKKETKKKKKKLVNTCVAHSFLHLYLLIGKIKAIDC